MNFSWISETKVCKRIKQLNFQRNIQLNYKSTSPTLDLLRETQKVKKTRAYYENDLFAKIQIGHTNPWAVENKKQIASSEIKDFKDDIEEYNYINDLIASEKEHLKKLEVTSKIFTHIIDETPGYISKMVRDHHISLWGYLLDIIDLHKRKILPKFETEKGSFSDILRYILQLIENNELYLYVSHAILYNSTLQWLDNYKIVLDNIYSKHGSYYNKLDIDDIIGLYKEWTEDVLLKLLTDPCENADNIALCMDVEQKLNHLLDVISDAKKVACIKEVSKNNIEAIEKLYQIMEKREVICHPMLILFPRYDCNHGYRNPIDVLKLGQFVRVWNEMSMFSDTSKCYYQTKLFIFERCIIYTIIVNDNHFLYNGHFWTKDCVFETVMKNDKPLILAGLRCGTRKLVLDNPEFVSALMRLHALHKFDEIDGEIELPFKTHVKILSKIEICGLRRMSMASSD